MLDHYYDIGCVTPASTLGVIPDPISALRDGSEPRTYVWMVRPLIAARVLST